MSFEGRSRFHTTQWSLITALPAGSDPISAQRADEALRHLCESYWRPLYAFVRYSGYTAEDAQDLTQAFLTRTIEDGGFGGADPNLGRFRSYILGAMKHFLANQRARAQAQKRGGDQRFVLEDVSELESRIGSIAQPETQQEVDRAFDRNWARETTSSAIKQLRSEWHARGKVEQFDAVSPALSGELPDRQAVAEQLGMTDNALGVAIHRLRHRYASLVREAVAQTVADEADVEEELRYLISVLREK